jgi:hypothetical protein
MPTRASTLIPLALIVLLLAAQPAAGLVEPLPIDPGVLALEEENEPEAEAEAAAEGGEACEEVEGLEECEEAEPTAKRSGSGAPEECLLRTARAHAALDRRSGKLKLTIRYTTYEPVNAKIEIRSGADRIASLKRHLARSGVLRVIKKLSAKGGKRLVVRIEIPSARSAGCPFRRLVLFPR